MTPFLRQVAHVYLREQRDMLGDCCFVFPNKRMGVFFRRYMRLESGGERMVMPETTTLAELCQEFSGLVEAPRLDRLFTLYNEYRQLGSEVPEFDRFMFWGDVLLADFDDVDRFLVDPDLLFVNLKRYREISANYLTPEQMEILSRYWGEHFAPVSPDEFWNHVHDEETPLEGKFLRLWEVLGPLYARFTERLLDQGLGTAGMMIRRAASLLNDADWAPDNTTKRYVFVGFNVLSLAEIKIFERLRKRGMADFYWDVASPAMADADNRAFRFMRQNARMFPSRYALDDYFDEPAEFPEIHVTGVPSAVGQAKMAGRQLIDWAGTGAVGDVADAIDTAVILPDENLFIPMVHSVPDIYCNVNITMGFPLRLTPLSALMETLVAMHSRASLSRGEWAYFHEDVRAVVSHPLLQGIDAGVCNAILARMSERRLYMVPVGVLMELAGGLAFMFRPVADTNSVEECHQRFYEIASGLRSLLAPLEGKELEVYFLDAYMLSLEELRAAVERHGITMGETSFLRLLHDAVRSFKVNFAGEPLKGLQVMGVLETRGLDFDNLMLLSMNERVFPRRQYARSFIPDALRHSYGLMTLDFQECVFAYHFYRLISRAKRVRIFYDARTVSGSNSEMSRYISQLLYLFPSCRVTHDLVAMDALPRTPEAIVVRKTPEIMAKLAEFTRPGGKKLSASSINKYINCPLAFYLSAVCDLNLDEEATDYMDSATYGSIMHSVAERLYLELKGDAASVIITPEILDMLINSDVKLDRLITETINEFYNRLPRGSATPLEGESLILGNVMKHFVKLLLRKEKEFAPFEFIAAEYRIESRMEISPGVEVNIKQFIDRVDRVFTREGVGRLRLVDYKTGNDEISFSSVSDLFDPENASRRKAILQLMFYCNAYAASTGCDEPIQPIIYKMGKLATEGLRPLSYNKKPFEDYREINEEFLREFRRVVSEILDPDVPFTQALVNDHCQFCSFRPICRRQ